MVSLLARAKTRKSCRRGRYRNEKSAFILVAFLLVCGLGVQSLAFTQKKTYARVGRELTKKEEKWCGRHWLPSRSMKRSDK